MFRSHAGSMREVYDMIDCGQAPEGNKDFSFVTIVSQRGLMFGIINIIGERTRLLNIKHTKKPCADHACHAEPNICFKRLKGDQIRGEYTRALIKISPQSCGSASKTIVFGGQCGSFCPPCVRARYMLVESAAVETSCSIIH